MTGWRFLKMTGVVQKIMGGDKAGKMAREQAAAQQRRALAEMAMAAGQEDQAKAGTGKKRGRGILTFLGADGQATLG
jgi:hypothetical protein